MITSSKNYDVTVTDLDSVLYQEWEENNVAPNQATARTADIFRPRDTSLGAYKEEIFKGTGLWGKVGETQTIPTSEARVTNKLTTSPADFADSIELSKNFFDDEHHGVWQNAVRNFARMAKRTQDDNAMRFWRNSFTTSLGADGVSIINSAHPLIDGSTESNLVTGALSETTLENGFLALQKQKNQAGVVMGAMPSILLVPTALYGTALKIAKSVLQPATGNNDLNYFYYSYGALRVYQCPLLDYNSITGEGSNKAWFLLADNHNVTRLIRQGMETALTHWSYSRNRSYVYQGNFREETYCADYSGIVGSTGV